jgi:predicted acyltransferase
MKKLEQMSNSAVLAKIFKRTIIIFLIGYLLSWFPFFDVVNGHWAFRPLSHTRIVGVLQRIALCYCFASLMIHYLSTRTVYILSAVFLVGYWVILMVFGWMNLHTFGNDIDPLSMTGNAGFYLDKWLFGEAHMYHGEGIAFEPEGILSTMTSIVNVVIGYYVGKFIQTNGKNYTTVAKLLLTGCLFIFIAICLDPLFPMNKKLWSSSFVLITTGIDMVIISFLIYSLEIQNWNWGNWARFFTIPGKNPLFIYIVSEVLLTILAWVVIAKKSLPEWVDNFWLTIAPGRFGSLLFSISFMLVCWLVAYIMDKRKIYVRV